jgi:intracellular septation protein A
MFGERGAVRTLLLDLSSGLLFFAVLLATGNIYVATVVGIGVGLATVAWTKAHRRQIDVMQWLGVGLVVVLGGATILAREPRFVMFKPTVLQVCLGLMALRPGWMARYLPTRATARMSRQLLVATGYVYSAALFAMAGVNAAFATAGNQKVWAAYNALGPTLVFSLMGAATYLIIRRAVRRAHAAEAHSSARIA